MLKILLATAILLGPGTEPSEVQQDTVGALEEASRLIRQFYASSSPERPTGPVECPDDIRETCEDPNWQPIHPREFSESCSGSTPDDCFAGDWDCVGRYLGDCRNRGDRARLIERLDALGRVAGASAWLYRQRVGFAVKHGDLEAASRIAEDCGSIDWFCPALRGFVAHQAQAGAGLAAFDSALALAPATERCEWNDISGLLEHGPTRDCGPAHTFWWLADPLWSRDGNERKAEHFSRHVMRWISWGASPRGAPGARLWEVERTRALAGQGFASIIAEGPVTSLERRVEGTRSFSVHEWRAQADGGYSFAPSPEALDNPVATTRSDWTVEWDQGHERMVTDEDWANLADQTVVLRRQGMLRVLSAAVVPSELQDGNASAHVALGRVPDRAVVIAPAAWDDRAVRAGLEVDSGSYVVSIEVLGLDMIGRSRHGIPMPSIVNGFGISDLAIVRADSGWEARDPLEILLPSTEVARDEPIGLYFEVYGVSEEDLQVTLSTEERRRGFWSRIKSFFGGSAQAVKVEWTEAVTDHNSGGIFSRTVLLDGDGLESGEHQLVLEVRRGSGEVASASSHIRIVD